MAIGTLLMAWVLGASAATPADVASINRRNFKIPIQINENRRAEIKELILFASDDQGNTWNQVAVATPDKDAFSYLAPADGLYWFSVCVVDPQGNRQPPDIYKAPPNQKIRVDTLKPTLRIVSADRQGEDVAVAWETQEDYPDLTTLKLEYRPADAPAWSLWYTAPLNQAAGGQTRFRHLGPTLIRIQVQDQAGNQATVQTEVAAATTTAAVSPPPTPHTAKPQAESTQHSTLSTQHSALSTSPAPRSEAWILPERSYSSMPASHYQQGTPAGADAATRLVAISGAAGEPAALVPGSPGNRLAREALPPVQVVNSTQVSLEYELAKVGPSGVGTVELWLTQDDGRTWRRLADDPDLKPPITTDLPGEGVYGFRLVVQSGAGLSKGPPLAGDPPEVRLEVDTTLPVAQLYRPEPDPQRRDTLVIGWSATDRNLAPNPITLQWAERPDGSWQSIASDLPNSSQYHWQLPPNLPYRVYLRLVVRDTAGNTSVAETRESILVDLNKPEGRLLGIAGSLRRP